VTTGARFFKKTQKKKGGLDLGSELLKLAFKNKKEGREIKGRQWRSRNQKTEIASIGNQGKERRKEHVRLRIKKMTAAKETLKGSGVQ